MIGAARLYYLIDSRVSLLVAEQLLQ